MIKRIEFDVDSSTAKEMNEFFAKGLLRTQVPRRSVSFSGSISISPGGFSLSWDPEKDPRTIPNLVEAIFDAIEIFKNRIKSIKIDGKGYHVDEAKLILLQKSAKESPFVAFEEKIKQK